MKDPLAPPPVTDFPAPPVDHFPHAVIDTSWVKARFPHPLPRWSFDEVRGWMLDETVKGDRRPYLFEVNFDTDTGRPAATVSACDPSNLNPFDRRDDDDRQITGLPKGSRPDLHDRALRAARLLRDIALAQQRWLLDMFETVAVPADVVLRSTGKPPDQRPHNRRTYAVHRGWLIIRDDSYGQISAIARRLDADGCAGNLVVREAGP